MIEDKCIYCNINIQELGLFCSKCLLTKYIRSEDYKTQLTEIIYPKNNKVESKYYTPKKEELHIGFECEMRFFTYENGEKVVFWKTIQINKEWFTDVIGIEKTGYSGGINLDSLIEGGGIRVKYLDREDIESEGWTFLNKDSNFHWFELSTGNEMKDIKENRWKIRLENNGRIQISQGTGWLRFLGFLKNRSELRRIMEQLQIK